MKHNAELQPMEVWGVGILAFVITAFGYVATMAFIYHPWFLLGIVSAMTTLSNSGNGCGNF
jgi:small-conductance mechanosensitive channel